MKEKYNGYYNYFDQAHIDSMFGSNSKKPSSPYPKDIDSNKEFEGFETFEIPQEAPAAQPRYDFSLFTETKEPQTPEKQKSLTEKVGERIIPLVNLIKAIKEASREKKENRRERRKEITSNIINKFESALSRTAERAGEVADTVGNVGRRTIAITLAVATLTGGVAIIASKNAKATKGNDSSPSPTAPSSSSERTNNKVPTTDLPEYYTVEDPTSIKESVEESMTDSEDGEYSNEDDVEIPGIEITTNEAGHEEWVFPKVLKNGIEMDLEDLKFLPSEQMKDEINRAKEIFENNRYTYEEISRLLQEETGIYILPELICAIHWRESGCKFNTYPHNGDPLGKPTVNEPLGKDFKSFIPAAVDAYKGVAKYNFKAKAERLGAPNNSEIKTESAISAFAECFNGTGARDRFNAVSGYAYSGTSMYNDENGNPMYGRFISDSNYDPNDPDKRPGVLLISVALIQECN